MTDRTIEIETVVLTRDYLEQIHGRMTFVETEDGADGENAGEAPVATATATDAPPRADGD
jgi:hypothetical protein